MKKKQSKSLPEHIAIIMDGNRRWAADRGLSTLEGHRAGVDNTDKIIIAASDLGIQHLTFYVFSSENWNRSIEEVKGLMSLLGRYIKTKNKKLLQKNIRVKFSGNFSRVSPKLLSSMEDLMEQSKDNSGMNLVLALSYGGRQEIVDATKKIAMQYKEGACSCDEINEVFFRKFLYVPEVPDPDLFIRTGGVLRTSNFLLWQMAYTEFYFIKKYWPDFTKKDLETAILEFQNRERRYGK